MSDSDQDDQLNKGIHYHGNIEKALNQLIGICRGIAANDVVNEDELVFLNTWLMENGNLGRDGDYVDLLDLTDEILKQESIASNDLDELLTLITDMLEYRPGASAVPFSSADVAVERLIGLCRGLLSDNELDDKEITSLAKWLVRCGDLTSVWPISVLKNKVDEILADNIITTRERNDLFDAMAKIIGGTITETGTVTGTSSSLANNQVDHVDFENNEFCLTGKFVFGSRAVCKSVLLSLGAVTHDRVRLSTRYLVVGSLSSPDWKNSSHGRKIGKAIELQDKGFNVTILGEDAWLKFAGQR